MADVDRCIICSAPVPEGRMVCPMCESGKKRDPSKTKFMLRQYRDMEWKAHNAEQIIRECNDMMTSLGGSSGPRVQGGGNTRESLLINCIERKTRCEAAVNFMRMMDGAMAGLDESERDIIFNFHIDHNGIGWVCRTRHVGKTRAYELCDLALSHLDSLLF